MIGEFILAGTYAQALYYKERYQSAKDTVIYNQHSGFLGVTNGKLFLCGTYYERKDITEIIKEAEVRKMEIIKLYG